MACEANELRTILPTSNHNNSASPLLTCSSCAVFHASWTASAGVRNSKSEIGVDINEGIPLDLHWIDNCLKIVSILAAFDSVLSLSLTHTHFG